jgi:hypothetical protein
VAPAAQGENPSKVSISAGREAASCHRGFFSSFFFPIFHKMGRKGKKSVGGDGLSCRWRPPRTPKDALAGEKEERTTDERLNVRKINLLRLENPFLRSEKAILRWKSSSPSPEPQTSSNCTHSKRAAKGEARKKASRVLRHRTFLLVFFFSLSGMP